MKPALTWFSTGRKESLLQIIDAGRAYHEHFGDPSTKSQRSKARIEKSFVSRSSDYFQIVDPPPLPNWTRHQPIADRPDPGLPPWLMPRTLAQLLTYPKDVRTSYRFEDLSITLYQSMTKGNP